MICGSSHGGLAVVLEYLCVLMFPSLCLPFGAVLKKLPHFFKVFIHFASLKEVLVSTVVLEMPEEPGRRKKENENVDILENLHRKMHV
jgi:hypothetical protein